jgi:hypothetical protein
VPNHRVIIVSRFATFASPYAAGYTGLQAVRGAVQGLGYRCTVYSASQIGFLLIAKV